MSPQPRLQLAQTDFTDADLTGSDWSDSLLEAADLTGAKIDSVQFARARAREARFFGATGEMVRFESADLRESRADATTRLPGTGFSHASLQDAKWDGAQLQGSQCIQSNMDRAVFSGADFFRGHVQRHQRAECRLQQDHFRRRAVCSTSICSTPRCARPAWLAPRLGQSNLFGANLYKIRVADAKMQDLNLKRTLLDPALFSD